MIKRDINANFMNLSSVRNNGYPEKQVKGFNDLANEIRNELPVCCDKVSKNQYSYELLIMLGKLKALHGNFKVTSGIRCYSCNEKVGGVKNSSHIVGEAVDIAYSNDNDLFELVRDALAIGFVRIGIGKGFIHLDISTCKKQRVMWLY